VLERLGSYYLTLLIAQVEESRFAERRSALRVYSLCMTTDARGKGKDIHICTESGTLRLY
jgi:hypothetical protein